MTGTRRLIVLILTSVLSAVLMVGVVVPSAPPAEARSVKDLQDQRDRNRREREEIKSALEGTDAKLAELYLDLDDTRRKLAEAQTELIIRQEELAAAERELQAVRERLDVARAEKDTLDEAMAQDALEIASAEAAMGDVARAAYRGSGNISALAVVMNAGSLQEFADSYSAMNNALRNQGVALGELQDGNVVNENRQARLEAVEERIVELEAEAEELVAVAEDKRAQAAGLVNQVEDLERRQEAQADEFEKFIADGEEQLSKLKRQDSQLADDIAEIHAAEERRRAEEERRRKEEEARRRPPAKPATPSAPGASTTPKPPSTGGGGSGATGALIPPIARSLYVTSAWGYRVYPITGGWFMHNGVDLRSACGEAQLASAAGTVTAVRGAYGNGTHGNQVMINHGTIGGSSYRTVYNHLSGFAVSPGQKVSQGQTIGYTGATGKVTGCHVHFEVWRDGKSINPMTLPAFR